MLYSYFPEKYKGDVKLQKTFTQNISANSRREIKERWIASTLKITTRLLCLRKYGSRFSRK